MRGKCDVYQQWPDWPCTLRKAMSAPAWAQKLFDPGDSESELGRISVPLQQSRYCVDTDSMEASGDPRWLIGPDFGVEIQKRCWRLAGGGLWRAKGSLEMFVWQRCWRIHAACSRGSKHVFFFFLSKDIKVLNNKGLILYQGNYHSSLWLLKLNIVLLFCY